MSHNTMTDTIESPPCNQRDATTDVPPPAPVLTGNWRYTIKSRNGLPAPTQAPLDCWANLPSFPDTPYDVRDEAVWEPYLNAMGLKRNDTSTSHAISVDGFRPQPGRIKFWPYAVYILIACSPQGKLSVKQIHHLALCWCAALKNVPQSLRAATTRGKAFINEDGFWRLATPAENLEKKNADQESSEEEDQPVQKPKAKGAAKGRSPKKSCKRKASDKLGGDEDSDTPDNNPSGTRIATSRASKRAKPSPRYNNDVVEEDLELSNQDVAGPEPQTQASRASKRKRDAVSQASTPINTRLISNKSGSKAKPAQESSVSNKSSGQGPIGRASRRVRIPTRRFNELGGSTQPSPTTRQAAGAQRAVPTAPVLGQITAQRTRHRGPKIQTHIKAYRKMLTTKYEKLLAEDEADKSEFPAYRQLMLSMGRPEDTLELHHTSDPELRRVKKRIDYLKQWEMDYAKLESPEQFLHIFPVEVAWDKQLTDDTIFLGLKYFLDTSRGNYGSWVRNYSLKDRLQRRLDILQERQRMRAILGQEMRNFGMIVAPDNGGSEEIAESVFRHAGWAGREELRYKYTKETEPGRKELRLNSFIDGQLDTRYKIYDFDRATKDYERKAEADRRAASRLLRAEKMSDLVDIPGKEGRRVTRKSADVYKRQRENEFAKRAKVLQARRDTRLNERQQEVQVQVTSWENLFSRCQDSSRRKHILLLASLLRARQVI